MPPSGMRSYFQHSAITWGPVYGGTGEVCPPSNGRRLLNVVKAFACFLAKGGKPQAFLGQPCDTGTLRPTICSIRRPRERRIG